MRQSEGAARERPTEYAEEQLCSIPDSGNVPDTDLKLDEVQSASAVSTHSLTHTVNQRSKYVTQVQQQRLESPTVTLIWYACTSEDVPLVEFNMYLVFMRMPGESYWYRRRLRSLVLYLG